ncbi:MAG TPA: hypothetical protein VKR43_07460 [Bryobacteraceae bacterium]|nr:hypothetical protein [Bryobacteraceae bacterium]
MRVARMKWPCAVPVYTALACAAILSSAGCFVRKRVVVPQGQPANRPVLTATKDELLARIRRASGPIQNFSMKADMSPSVGSVNGGELTDYATIRAYILFRRPRWIRVLGLDPVVHSTTILDMVSMGKEFRVFIPSRNNFILGDDAAPPNSKNKLENLRPAAFLDALVIEPPDASDLTVLEDDTDPTRAVYRILILRQEKGQLRLMRAVSFSRYTLEIIRQRTFDATGAIVSETQYSDWKEYGGISYASNITIRRPQDGYEVAIAVVELKFNAPDVTPDKFVLEQPAGSHVIQMK